MTDQHAIEIIEKEFKNKTLAVTEQYLEIHSPIYVDNRLRIDRIDRDRKDGLIIAYLPMLGERFYFSVYIDTNINEVVNVGTESFYHVCFRVTSETLLTDDLRAITQLAPTEFWNKEDLKKRGKLRYTFSNLTFLPNPEPDEFEDKLKKLLDFLEQDKNGIKELVKKADCYIQVEMDIHSGNGMLGEYNIDTEDIKE
ncbi:DUF4279 domain-containing protein [Riemerella anatipestifer]|uniref:DUF4279 domain-containing protein n=1 Tax=Riemerella anatipestifer TaxID=34085 RepID=A0AAP6LLP6_RIEAN|nr:DUF4279 domain-containing protein [Riemerella anatipestifer]MBT0549702.1 DUF4279 domain-containing protein [Riemerella anatipestifer]MBT0556336.1 DUF4279 domain-containing protein [Riemerella anatipestifer]MBT0560465.1 DUF4279 domain-containing protein [Riemerella anatipestifer]MCO7354134.1 DUF4279 domain-containing protein [Riemerella anatipestifer]MCU7570019.1 DUF4279 domain-containing protein [Riemerella anatipestifer]